MSILLWIIAIAILALLIYAATKPKSFRIERSTEINASPQRVFEQIDNFRNWQAWSPWEKLDPDLKRSYSGAESGVRAAYGWQGNGKAGAGRMEIIEATTPSRVLINLDFEKPFKASNKAEFTLTPTGSGTRVNWAMYGPQPYMVRLMTTVFNMEKAVGGDFEKGLANLKRVAEA